MKKIGVGIAGLGRSGWNIHARLLDSLDDQYQIVAVTDPDTGRMEEARERLGCRTYTSYDELIGDEDVELVIVATPSHLHADYSIAAMRAGKGVVCEKPMATTLADADRMIAVARESGCLLTVFQNRRYSPDFVQVRKVIESGVLGRIVMIHITVAGFGRRWDWQTLKKYGGGSLNNTGVHFLDQAMLLFGDAEPQVFCHMERTLTLGDAEDHVKLIVYAEGAPMIDLEVTSACAYPPNLWNILGTRGGLTGDMRNLRWKYVLPEEMPPRELDPRPTPDRSYNHDQLLWHEETWQAPQGEPPWADFYRDLYETLCNGRPLAITPQSVRRTMWVIEKCHSMSPV